MLKRSLTALLISAFACAILNAQEHSPIHQPTLTPQNSGTTNGLIAVWPVNPQVVWASGRAGTFTVTTDGGQTWRAGVVPGAEMLQFRDVQAFSASVAYLLSIGTSGDPTDFRIYKTVDGGATWTIQFENQNPNAFYDGFAFWTPHRGIAHSDSVNGVFPDLRTTDGTTWQDISKGLPENLRKDSIRGNSFFANDKGLFLRVGNGLYHSTPNATAPFWTKEIFPDEHSNIAHGKAGIFAYNCWGSGIFQKTNGTGVWSPVFTNFQEKRVLSVFETAGGTIFIGSDRGLFKSTNSGKSWKQLHAGWGKMVESNSVLLATSQRGTNGTQPASDAIRFDVSVGSIATEMTFPGMSALPP